MKKILLIILSISVLGGGVYFLFDHFPKTTSSKNEVSQRDDSQKELAAFKEYSETLVYDIYYFNPEDDYEKKRASLFERMTEPLVEQMCPNIPELVENNQNWNDVLKVETIDINEIDETNRETVTNYSIKTSTGQEFDLRSRAVYEKQDGKWIMTDITPEEREG